MVGTFGVLYHFGGELSENGDEIWAAVAQDYTALSAYAFMIFNLLCAPCFAAIGAIKREMNNAKWTWFAIGYQCGFAYLIALMINQFGNAFTGSLNVIGLIAAIAALAFGLVPKNMLTEYGVQIGSALEMLLLSIALSYRYASLRNENERIVHEARDQLEQKVALRTTELRTALDQLEQAHDRLSEFSRHDGLTELYNRTHFREAFEHLLSEARNSHHPISLLMIDLDHFKNINDRFGHGTGDWALKEVAEASKGFCRRIVLPADAVAYHVRRGAQHVVAGRMAVVVVDRLEMVDVDHQQRGRIARRRALFKQRGRALLPVPPAVQAGQRVAPAQLVQLAVLALHLADQAVTGLADRNGVDQQHGQAGDHHRHAGDRLQFETGGQPGRDAAGQHQHGVVGAVPGAEPVLHVIQ